jgi:hypothetical protein
MPFNESAFTGYIGLPYDFELDKEITELAASHDLTVNVMSPELDGVYENVLQDFGRLNVWLDAESVITHFSIE